MALDEKQSRIAVATIAQRLNISKIYLEQVFSILKRGGLIASTKGAQGGYTLSQSPDQITIYNILAPIELMLFESSEQSLENIPPEAALIMDKLIFKQLDEAVTKTLKSVTLADLAAELKNKRGDSSMYYI